MKYYVVADVHGFYSELKVALKEKGFFDEKEPHKLIVCGDLFDRGTEATEMQDFIVDLIKKDEVILVRGNHEDLALEFVENIKRWLNPQIFSQHHWRNGTVETLLNLTGYDVNYACCDRVRFAQKVKLTPYFNEIIPSMVNYFETEKYIFVHGWIPCATIGEEKRPSAYMYTNDWRNATQEDWETARWYNGMEAARQGVIEPNKTIVCGHFYCSYGHSKINGVGSERGEDANFSPYYNKGIIAIDAHTALSKKVNCIIIED